MINNTPRPRTQRPTTPRPITAPPAKATSNAFPRLVLAALVVLTFAFVATRIPINPAKAEQIAPKTKETAISQEEFSAFAVTARRIATANTKIESTLYSAFKNAIAPSAIFSAIRAMRSVPTSCLDTHDERQNVYNKANTPNTGIASVIV